MAEKAIERIAKALIKWAVKLNDFKKTSGEAAQLSGDSICSGVRPLAPSA